MSKVKNRACLENIRQYYGGDYQGNVKCIVNILMGRTLHSVNNYTFYFLILNNYFAFQ